MVHDAGGGGGGGYTNWWSTSIPQMWAMVSHYDTSPQWTHVTGWRKTFELTSYHLARMQQYRDKIATTWPPERNEAARTYLARIDEMIASIQATYDAASTNYTTVAGATAAIDSARYKLKPIYDEYVANQQRLAPPPSSTPTPTPMPSPGPSPVAPGRQEQLASQARNVMIELSGTLASARYSMITPPAYTAPRVRVDDGTTGPGDGASLTPAVIPPLTLTPSYPDTSRSAQPGPQLSGGRSANLAPAPQNPVLPQLPPSQTGPTPGPIPSHLGIPPTGGQQQAQPTSPAPSTTTRPAAANAPTSRPLPPGGLIGGPLGAGVAQNGNRIQQRINPVGGLITGPTGGAPSRSLSGGVTEARQRQVASAAGVPGKPGGTFRTPDGHLVSISGVSPSRRRSRKEAREETGGWDPENPWAVAEGVDPVVMPPEPPGPHDPGPAIGLIR